MEPAYSGGGSRIARAALSPARGVKWSSDGDARPIGDDRPQLRESGQRFDYIFTTDMLNLNKSQNAFFERVSEIIGVLARLRHVEDSLHARARNGARRGRHHGRTNARDEDSCACCDAVIDSFDELP